jgi:hypothetical protein
MILSRRGRRPIMMKQIELFMALALHPFPNHSYSSWALLRPSGKVTSSPDLKKLQVFDRLPVPDEDSRCAAESTCV